MGKQKELNLLRKRWWSEKADEKTKPKKQSLSGSAAQDIGHPLPRDGDEGARRAGSKSNVARKTISFGLLGPESQQQSHGRTPSDQYDDVRKTLMQIPGLRNGARKTLVTLGGASDIGS